MKHVLKKQNYKRLTKHDVRHFAILCSNSDKKDCPIDTAIILNACNESESVPGDEDYVQEELTAFNPTVKRVVSYMKA